MMDMLYAIAASKVSAKMFSRIEITQLFRTI